MTDQSDNTSLDSRRFKSIYALYGDRGLTALQASHVVVIGVGGFGSWADESLPRNEVAAIMMIEMDIVSESNIIRQ